MSIDKKVDLRKRKILITVTILVIFIFGGIALTVYYHQTNRATTTKPTDFYPKSEDNKKVTPPTTPTPNSPTPTIAPTTAPQTSNDSKITIASPTQGGIVSDGTQVSGIADTSSNVLYYRLKGGATGQIASGQIGITPNQSSPYSFKLGFTNSVSKGGDQGELEVYTLNANGVADSIASVAVNIQE